MPAGGILERVTTEAIRLGTDTLEVEYKDGYEWVFVVSGSLGVGIAQFRSSSRNGARLRQECHQLARHHRWQGISVDGRGYQVRCTVYDSFGEDAFRVSLRPVSTTPSDTLTKARRKPTA